MIIVATLKQVHHEILENTCKNVSDADSNNGHGYSSTSSKMVVLNIPELWMQIGACFGLLTSIVIFTK